MEDSILELIGNTPLVRFRRLFADFQGEVAAKLEEFNPTGSVKVRVALGLIREAERTGALSVEELSSRAHPATLASASRSQASSSDTGSS